jgi:LacI family transcriptional regulator
VCLFVICYIVRGNRFERYPANIASLIGFIIRTIVNCLALDQINCSLHSAIALTVGILEYGHRERTILDCLNTIYRCIDANDRDRSRIHALSLQRLYRTKCHRIVVRDDAVKFGVAQQRRNHVHCVCTVIICNQRSRRLRCLDAIVLQCLQYGSGALFSMYQTQRALQHQILNFGLALILEVISQKFTLIVTGGVLIGNNRYGLACFQNAGIGRCAVNENNLHITGSLDALLCRCGIYQIDQHCVIACIFSRFDKLEHLAGIVLDAARREARRLAAFSVEVIFRLSPSLDPVEQVSIIENLVEQHHISALAITPLDCLLVETKINELIDQRGIPVVTFNTDLPNSRRLCYVGQENISSGRTVAELMRLVTRESGTVATIITPCMYHSAYRERLKGFKEELLTPDSPLQLQEVTLPNDDSNVVYEHTLRLLQETPELTGIYAITPGYAGACSALVDSGRARGVHLIMHDEIPANLYELRRGVADFVIGQDAVQQGALPLSLLADYIQLKQQPPKEFYHTDIRVLLRHNIENLL